MRKARDQDIRIWINGKKGLAETTELVVRRMIGSREIIVDIRSEVELSVSQGFGMSGAGALSTAYALDKAMKLGLPKIELIQIAHVAEVEAMTGLGDVYPQSQGGLETRTKSGAPPFGKLARRASRKKLVLCVVGGMLKTKDVLRNPVKRNKINDIGRRFMEEYLKAPTWPKLFELSSRFAESTNLASRKILKVLEEVEAQGGRAGMAMLGNSIFASGDEKKLVRLLKQLGKVFICTVDNQGARIIPRV